MITNVDRVKWRHIASLGHNELSVHIMAVYWSKRLIKSYSPLAKFETLSICDKIFLQDLVKALSCMLSRIHFQVTLKHDWWLRRSDGSKIPKRLDMNLETSDLCAMLSQYESNYRASNSLWFSRYMIPKMAFIRTWQLFFLLQIYLYGVKPFRQSCSTMVPCIKIHNTH